MKRLTDRQIGLIDAWLAESEISEITPALLEKDVHVTDVLTALQQIDHPELSFVFCGGTSLSKAYNLVERMSEDVDLKVIPKRADISRSALKNQLSELKSVVAESLAGIGLVEDSANRRSLDENRYVSMKWFYAPVYESHGSLRPHLSIEFTARRPRCPAEDRPFGYMLDRLLNAPFVERLPCVIPAETLAEKILSFLRRYAQYRTGQMRQAWDTALVRHIYDTYCIFRAEPTCLVKAKHFFGALVSEDVSKFGKQFPDFSKHTKATLKQSLKNAESDSKLVDEYRKFLLPLIYGRIRPTYQEAFATFKHCANELLPEIVDD